MSGSAIVILSMLACADAFIIPEEIPTLLSVIYSNIPPIKLGFDTRLGFGFRLGPHADFQTVVEIGPQENTRPIGMGNETVGKRQSLTRTQAKLLAAAKKPAAESTGDSNLNGNETIEPSLAGILLGRKAKKQPKPYFNEIQFKKVPGIDDLKKTAKTAKPAKFKPDKNPTKIVIFKYRGVDRREIEESVRVPGYYTNSREDGTQQSTIPEELSKIVAENILPTLKRTTDCTRSVLREDCGTLRSINITKISRNGESETDLTLKRYLHDLRRTMCPGASENSREVSPRDRGSPYLPVRE